MLIKCFAFERHKACTLLHLISIPITSLETLLEVTLNLTVIVLSCLRKDVDSNGLLTWPYSFSVFAELKSWMMSLTTLPPTPTSGCPLGSVRFCERGKRSSESSVTPPAKTARSHWTLQADKCLRKERT